MVRKDPDALMPVAYGARPWLAIALLLAASPLRAAQAADDIHTLDRERVSASALPVTAAAASQHVTVLERADLDALQGLSAADILARQAGVVIDRGAGSGGFGALYLRGADPSHVVVLIDHVRQNDPLSSRGSAVDLNTLSSDDIERIEIVRGNASVVNAEAIAGLIHIFTRRAASGAALGTSIGGDGLRAAQASWSGAGLRASATQREESGDAGARNRVRAANLGWDGALGERTRLHAAARYSDSRNLGFPDDSGGDAYAVIRALDRRHSRSRQLSLRGEYRLRHGGAIEAQLATLTRDGEEDTPGVAPGLRDPFGLPAMRSLGDYRRDEAQLHWLLLGGDQLMFTVGAQYQRERGDLDSLIDFGGFVLPAGFALRRSTASAFAEARWQAGPWTAQGGLRYEHPDRGDAASHPMLSLQRALAGERGEWGLSVARSSKLPSFYALAHPLVGNPALKPERALHRELYYASSADARWGLRLTLFDARYRDLIDFDAGPPPQLVNRARIETRGLEWRLGRRYANDWRLQFEGSWMHVQAGDGAGGETRLRYRPRAQFSASLALPLGERRELSLALRHLGRRDDSSIPTGERRLDATTTLDLSLRQQWGPAQLLLAIDNLADARGEEAIGTRSPGRRLRLALRWSLQ
ncbi:iron complex outermembrane recepter protein [Lysobacter sp. cf310]|nr:iron complex outermembrane recepter protein [Lysobacter sp. cf310]